MRRIFGLAIARSQPCELKVTFGDQLQAAASASIANGMMEVMRQSLDAACILSRLFKIDINSPMEIIFLCMSQIFTLARSRAHTVSRDRSDGG